MTSPIPVVAAPDNTTPAPPGDTIVIGTVVGVFGIKGECKVHVQSDGPERLLGLKTIWVERADGSLEFRKIHKSRVHKGQVLLKFSHVDDADAAEQFLRRNLHIDLADRQPLGESQYYVTDLIGLRVDLPDGRTLGTLTDLVETGANDVYIVEGELGHFLIPATKEVIARVDLEERVMHITPLPGLLELPEAPPDAD